MAAMSTTTTTLAPASALDKSVAERVGQSVLFELLAVLLCSPLLGAVFDQPATTIGALTLSISLIAMTWNVIYNAGFDALQRRHGFQRGAWVRVLHAGGFELGLALVTIPLIAWWLAIGWWEALMLDLGFLLFFLPYTLVFHALYDRGRERLLARRSAR